MVMACGRFPRSLGELVLSGFSLFSNEGRVVEKCSLVGCGSFQSGNSSVDSKAQDRDHSGAQCHSQPEGGAAHIRAVQVSGKRKHK